MSYQQKITASLKNVRELHIGLTPYLLPKLVVAALFFAIPFFISIYMSMHQWSVLNEVQPFIGLENYRTLINDPQFWTSAQNTVFLAAGALLINIPLALFLAVLVNTRVRGSKFFSASIFMPVVISWVVVAVIWRWMYNPNIGLINQVFSMVGLPTFAWLQTTETAMASITITFIWKQLGFNMVIFIAGLQNIPTYCYEAAKIDGANRFQTFFYITLPQLKPTLVFTSIITLIFAFRLFTPIFVMTKGGPVRSSTTLVYYLYEQGLELFNMGYATTIGVALFVVLFVLSVAQNQLVQEE